MSTRCPVHADFDPLVPERFESAHAQYAELRARCPVARSEAYGGFWALTKYDDVARALGDPTTFVTSTQNVVPKVAFTGRRPPLHLDPPEHTPYRAALNPLLAPERVAKLEPMVRRHAVELLSPMIESGEADICEAFGSHLPVRVFGHWMNLPPPLEQALSQAGPAFIRAVQSAQDEVMREASLTLYDMARALIALRKQSRLDPAVDPTSALLAARHDGERLPEDMIVGMVRQVLVVGIVAPMVMVGAMAVHLSQHPALQQQLRDDRALVPAAVEEFLRLYTPYRGFARTATVDVEFRGRMIAKDEPIALLYASANRDEDVFPDPASFQLHRPNIREHLAFGRGPHYCAGAALARLELQVALDELLARTRHFELAGEIVMTPFPEIGPWRVPLRFTPA
jgi:cytochrome P450